MLHSFTTFQQASGIEWMSARPSWSEEDREVAVAQTKSNSESDGFGGTLSPASVTTLRGRHSVTESKPRVRVRGRTGVGEVYLSAREPVDLYTFDAAYLRRLRGGDPATESHFVTYFSELLRIKLRGRMLPPQVIEDVCQETFLRVLTAARDGSSIHSPDRLGAFVNSVCKNVLLEYYRTNSRTQQVDADALDVPDGRTDLESAVLQQEGKRVVAEVLAQLSERDRKCLCALFLEDRDKDEVCQQFGVERAYLRVLVHRAKNSFRAHYGGK
jgi:RNA polymerase sigma-70 factor (ECF subfamily)